MTRFILIGLDCAAPELVFGKYQQRLPNIQALMKKGIWGPMKSTDPPITVPAWASMVTSKDPGQLGFYGFRNRRNHNYDELSIATSDDVREKTIWNHLKAAGLPSLLVGVPQTYPPKSLHGLMVSCFLTPSKKSQWTYPASFAKRVEVAAGGDYLFDVDDFRREDLESLYRNIVKMTETRFQTFRHFLDLGSYAFSMVVEIGLDRLQHRFWRYADGDHPLHDPDNRFRNVLADYYALLDREIGKTLATCNPDTHILVVSDHGAKPMLGAIGINQFLIQEGLLQLKQMPSAPTPLTPEMVNWDQTVCWGEGGYYGRVFLNIKGREPRGILPAGQAYSFAQKLKEKFASIPGPKGEFLGTKVLLPGEIYRETRGVPPDLLVYFGNLDYRASGFVGIDSIYLAENDSGIDDANHAENGVLIFCPAPPFVGVPKERYSIYDVAPTVLRCLGLEVPKDMIGTPLCRSED